MAAFSYDDMLSSHAREFLWRHPLDGPRAPGCAELGSRSLIGPSWSEASSKAGLRGIYFGAPILPSRFTKPLPQVAPVKVAEERRVANAAKTKRNAATPHARTKTAIRKSSHRPSSVAFYKEAVRPKGIAFSGEPAVRWRKCIPGLNMPLVCYLPAKDRLQITVYSAD